MSQQQTKRPNEDQHGPGNRAATHGRVKFNEDTIPTFKRLFSYYRGPNLVRFIIAMALIVVTALVSVKSSVFLGEIIDNFIDEKFHGNKNAYKAAKCREDEAISAQKGQKADEIVKSAKELVSSEHDIEYLNFYKIPNSF